MSLQDDIFDIEHALKRKPSEKAAFERVCSALNKLEEDADERERLLMGLAQGIHSLKKLWELVE